MRIDLGFKLSWFALLSFKSAASPVNIKNVAKLDKSNQACKVVIEAGFYVQDLFAFTGPVSSLADCLQVCLRTYTCYSVNYVPGMPDDENGVQAGGRCFLSGSSVENVRSLHAIDRSTYARFTCPEEHTPPHPFPTLFHGTSPRKCGTLAFAHPDPPSPPLPQDAKSSQKRIIAGTKAPPYSQPWLGQVVRFSDLICGASLISYKNEESTTLVAISAAHCFYDMVTDEMLPTSTFGFLFGAHDMRFPSAHAVYRTAEAIFLHASYNSQRNHDIAIVKLKEKIRFNDYVRPICLPESHGGAVAASIDPPIGVACSVCGYGSESVNQENCLISPSVPKCFKTKLSTPRAKTSGATVLTYANFYLSHLDAVRYKGASEGDSGGAVACLINNQFTIFGVIAGFGSSEIDKYRVVNIFTRVPFYLSWIHNAMAKINDGVSNDRVMPLKIDFEEEQNEISQCFPRCYKLP